MGINQQRIHRKKRIRKKIRGTAERPRLSVFRSSKQVYGQIIDDEKGVTLVSVSSIAKGENRTGKKTEKAKKTGARIAEKALKKNIHQVVFDRNGFLYKGILKIFAESAREAGLKF